ncbi:Dynein light chain 4, axonemal [Frankliniella fusca]|uniref:Dynein light chain n=1 Tax=Frankliniella fusca TaxID=407009 RepID=A0AAE1GZN0_9NEOP|nr:Dynein light chain 4, axonemal [Frankliniella fusca]
MGDAQNEPKKEEGEKKVLHTYALVRFCDMVEEMRTEAMDLSANACEKHSTNNESAAKMIKENMDKKFGPSWHAIVGEGYGFEISYEVKHLMYMYFGGNLAICVWKCS